MSEKRFEILYREALFQGFFRVDRFHLRQELFAGGWSAPFTREVFNGGQKAAVILLFDPKQDKIVMIEQFRAGPMAQGEDPFLIELVAGMAESGEALEDTARREALEEAGCEVTELQKIYAYYPSPGCMSEHTTIFIGRTIAPENGSLCGVAHENEDIRVLVLDATEAISLLYMGKLRDAASIIALQWFSLHHTDLRSRWLVSDVGTPII